MNQYLSILLLFSLPLLLPACTKDSNDDPLLPDDVADELVEGGEWRVVYYFDDDDGDETSDFNGYVFRFLENDVLEAQRNGQTTTGTWQTGTDDSKPKLEIFLGGNDPLEELNEDWVIVRKADNRLELEDDNDDDDENDIVHFERI